MPATAMPADVQVVTDSTAVPGAEAFSEWVDLALDGRDGEVCVRVVDLEEGHELNARYRNRDSATNVLSFATDDLPEGENLLGDIVVCAPVVEQEASDQNKAVEHHYAHMVIHGVLHLLGYDHESEGEAEAMEQLESSLLARMGIPDPYQARV